MRVGIFHPPLDLYGGAEVVAVASANALANSGFDVILFLSKEVNRKKIQEMIGEPLSSSVKTIINPALLKPRSMFHLYESAVRSFAFRSHCDVLVDTYSCYVFPWLDVSYIHFPYLNNYEFKSKFPYLKLAHLRHVITLPYAIFEKNLENYDDKLLLANSYFTAKSIRDSLGVDSEVLYPPIPNVLFNASLIASDVPREDLVVTVARFGQGKGVELVPDIAHRTAKNVRFVMIGLAHDKGVIDAVKVKIKKLNLSERVKIITDASRSDIQSFLSKAKVYLHTTKMEHFGISIAEAMAMGCLPVVHDSGGAPEFVPDKYRYKDAEDAAIIVDNAVDQWTFEESQKMAEIAERFSEKKYSKRFIDLFKKYIGSFNMENRLVSK